jgi:hypothetical protein
MAATTHSGQVIRPVSPTAPGPCDPRGGSFLRLFRFERRWLCRVFEAVLPPGEPQHTISAVSWLAAERLAARRVC